MVWSSILHRVNKCHENDKRLKLLISSIAPKIDLNPSQRLVTFFHVVK